MSLLLSALLAFGVFGMVEGRHCRDWTDRLFFYGGIATLCTYTRVLVEVGAP